MNAERTSEIFVTLSLSCCQGYPSVRHSLLRMHSQLRSASGHRRETSAAGPIDLSRCVSTEANSNKISTRSTSSNTTSTSSATPLRPVPIITSLIPTTTHTIYSSAVPSSSSSTAMSTNLYEQSVKSAFVSDVSDSKNFVVVFLSLVADQKPALIDQIVKYLSSPPPAAPRPSSPKLAYSYSNIEENLQCPLCIDRLCDPRALPCQHVFCCSCLKSIPSSNIPYPTIACPLCRRTFSYHDAEQFPVSYIHRQLLELVPKNYDISGKCRKCEDKTSLVLCSCCDYLLCQKCSRNDREIVLNNIQHAVQTCSFRLNKIHNVRERLNELNDDNRKKIQHVENLFETFEKKFFTHKQMILHSLKRFNEQIQDEFWSKLNLCSRKTTEPFLQLLQHAESLLKKPSSSSFEEILSLSYNLNSIDEQLEQAHRLLDTSDVQNLFKQHIQISQHDDSDEQIRIHCQTKSSTDEKVFPLIPASILPRSAKRLRKTEPKRHVESTDDLDDELPAADAEQEQEQLPLLKKMKVESSSSSSTASSPTSPIGPLLCFYPIASSDEEQGQNDNDIIYLQTVQAKSPSTISFDDLFQFIASD